MIKIGNLEIDIDRLEVRVYERVVKLSVEEMEVLKYLAMQPGEVISREFLLAKIYGKYGDIRTLDITIRRIRGKIEKDESNPKILITKRGIGYYLNNNIENVIESDLNTNEKEEKDVLDYNMQKTLIDKGFSQEECERLQKQVLYIANKFINTNAKKDDLISIGNIGLMKAINQFDTSKDIKFETYASRYIENEMLIYLRSCDKIEEPQDNNRSKNILGIDTNLRKIEDKVDKQLLKASIKKLSPRERNFMELRFGFVSGQEKTQKELADMLRNFAKLYFKA